MTRKQFFQTIIAVLTGTYFVDKIEKEISFDPGYPKVKDDDRWYEMNSSVTWTKLMSRKEFEDNWYGWEDYEDYLNSVNTECLFERTWVAQPKDF